MSERRNGITIIELLVAIGILGVLMAMLVPAVQQTRNSARNLECKNQLRQIGIALANAEEQKGEFPSNQTCLKDLLPLMGETAVFDLASQWPPPKEIPHVEFLMCPSETAQQYSHNGQLPRQIPSYRVNLGSMFPEVNQKNYNGFRIDRVQRNVKTRDFTDGLSQTAAYSERLIPLGLFQQFDVSLMERETGRFPWLTMTTFPRGQESRAIEQCRNNRTIPTNSWMGIITPTVTDMQVGYNHLLTPNHYACMNGPEPASFTIPLSNHLIPPSSLHIGGVNVLFADGSVHFVGNEISNQIWSAQGSRNGNETVQF